MDGSPAVVLAGGGGERAVMKLRRGRGQASGTLHMSRCDEPTGPGGPI